MNYDICKELKYAGFPQSGKSGEYFVGPTIYNPEGVSTSDMSRFYKPTLDELIEACGEQFKAVEQYPYAVQLNGKWLAKPWIMDADTNRPVSEFWYFGSTPTEAVARLWLALNKK